MIIKEKIEPRNKTEYLAIKKTKGSAKEFVIKQESYSFSKNYLILKSVFEVNGSKYHLDLRLNLRELGLIPHPLSISNLFIALADQEGTAIYFNSTGEKNISNYKKQYLDYRKQILGKRHILSFMNDEEKHKMNEVIKHLNVSNQFSKRIYFGLNEVNKMDCYDVCSPYKMRDVYLKWIKVGPYILMYSISYHEINMYKQFINDNFDIKSYIINLKNFVVYNNHVANKIDREQKTTLLNFLNLTIKYHSFLMLKEIFLDINEDTIHRDRSIDKIRIENTYRDNTYRSIDKIRIENTYRDNTYRSIDKIRIENTYRDNTYRSIDKIRIENTYRDNTYRSIDKIRIENTYRDNTYRSIDKIRIENTYRDNTYRSIDKIRIENTYRDNTYRSIDKIRIENTYRDSKSINSQNINKETKAIKQLLNGLSDHIYLHNLNNLYHEYKEIVLYRINQAEYQELNISYDNKFLTHYYSRNLLLSLLFFLLYTDLKKFLYGGKLYLRKLAFGLLKNFLTLSLRLYTHPQNLLLAV